MTIFIEPFRKPNEHMTFVTSLLYGEFSQNKRVVFYCSLDYYNSIPIEFRNKIIFKEINLSKSSIHLIFKIFKLTIQILNFYKNESEKKIFLLSSKSYSNLLLKIYSLFFLKKTRLYIYLHGELQNLNSKKSTSHSLDGLNQRILYRLDNLFKSNLKFVVISQFVFEKLCRTVKSNLKNFIFIDLPYYYSQDENTNLVKTSSILTISTVGVNSLNKNSHYLNEIAVKFNKEISNRELKLSIIGRNEGIIFDSCIEVPNLEMNQLLSEEQYSNRILESDFLVFFNHDNNYNLISSGSYFDCIKFRKPIIALKNAQWEYNFKKFGEIGKLFDNIAEMNDFIKNILSNKNLLLPYYDKLDQARNNTDIKLNIQIYSNKLN
jgi:hypothetical protein